MKNIIILIFLLVVGYLNAQDQTTDYFQIGDEKFLKPIKYILFNSAVDEKKTSEGVMFFYIQNQRFEVRQSKNSIDTCNTQSIKKIKFVKVSELAEQEFEYHKTVARKIEIDGVLISVPPPPTSHPYFKIYILEPITNGKYLKYESEWEYAQPSW
jgi:hypothetical protein